MADKTANSMIGKVAGWPAAVKSYIQELQLEMRRVTWPPWKQVRATTGVVLVCVFAFAVYFMVVDQVLTRSLGKVYTLLTK
jgi:preprotein translocase subunit SecE